ncbi:hypothetical protein C8F01DRAFT_1150417 [Mycena amicta]|nr:hypothetical protein C8F01DRAFT_1150417 [Mycena amicta]
MHRGGRGYPQLYPSCAILLRLVTACSLEFLVRVGGRQSAEDRRRNLSHAALWINEQCAHWSQRVLRFRRLPYLDGIRKNSSCPLAVCPCCFRLLCRVLYCFPLNFLFPVSGMSKFRDS